MTDFADLLSEVLPDVPGCSDPLAERAIRDAVIRLCEVSDILKESSEPVDVVVDQALYEIVVPDGYAYNQVLWVTVDDGPPLTEASQDRLDLAWREDNVLRALFSSYHTLGLRGGAATGWRAFTQDRPEVYYVERGETFDQLRLVGTPSALITDGLKYQISLKPLRTATAVRDFVVDDHYKLIAKGAIGALLSMNKQTWTDTTRGVALTHEFEAGAQDLKRLSLKDFTRDDRAVLRTRAYA
jgi:hypothetical protein